MPVHEAPSASTPEFADYAHDEFLTRLQRVADSLRAAADAVEQAAHKGPVRRHPIKGYVHADVAARAQREIVSALRDADLAYLMQAASVADLALFPQQQEM